MDDFLDRVRALNGAAVRSEGAFVLYWMIGNRRLGWNFALDRAVGWARELGKPLLILEALRCDYRWASRRIHRFVLDGMADSAARLEGSPVGYYPYVEPERGAGRGLLEALGARAAVVVTDDAPVFFLPRLLTAAARRLPVLLEAVDSYGLLPLGAAPGGYGRAYDFRRFLQRELPRHLGSLPAAKPLAGLELPASAPRGVVLPVEIERRWPRACAGALRDDASLLDRLPIDASVGPVELGGGATAAAAALDRFLARGLPSYGESRNQPDSEASSGLSPYLHFGHISAHEVFAAVAAREGWTPARLGSDVRGAREGWWGMSPAAEAFLDQLVTWRELGANAAARDEAHDRYESVPAWARRTLEDHLDDARPALYELETFERAETHDEIWNAAQRQLVREGTMHNYLRMLWGKKVIEWTAHPREAAEILAHLNNKYALDGRDPNSYSGIFWCFGRYDRPWAPVRPIFGSVRFMSSDSTRRKLDLRRYLAAYGEGRQLALPH